MTWGFNLRGDLAKLSDIELQDALDRFAEARKQTYDTVWDAPFKLNRWLYQKGLQMPLGRGPFHARIFYKFFALVSYGTYKPGSFGQLFLIDCGLKDILDEIKRRANLVSEGSQT